MELGYLEMRAPEQSGGIFTATAPATTTGYIEQVTDGDTVIVRANGRRLRIRLLGIDAPESNYRGRSQGQWAQHAFQRLRMLAPLGSVVRLVTDREQFDKYGRLLAYVQRGPHTLNVEMVRSGWAVPYQIYPNLRLLALIHQAAASAQARGLGVYNRRMPLPLMPYEFRWSIDGRAPDKFCGDVMTRRYVPPREYQRVPAVQRAFFPDEAAARSMGFTPAPALTGLSAALLPEEVMARQLTAIGARRQFIRPMSASVAL